MIRRYDMNVNEIRQRDSWLDLLDEHVRERFCNCVSRKSDILPLAQARWAALKQKEGFVPEDALVCVLELLDCNSQFFDLTRDEYDEILSQIV